MIHHILASAAPTNPGNPAISQIIVSTASAVTTALLFYLVRILRRFMNEHEYLMETTKANTEAIKRLLEIQEKFVKPATSARRRTQ